MKHYTTYIAIVVLFLLTTVNLSKHGSKFIGESIAKYKQNIFDCFLEIYIKLLSLSLSLSLNIHVFSFHCLRHLVTWLYLLCCHSAFEKYSAKVEMSSHTLSFVFILICVILVHAHKDFSLSSTCTASVCVTYSNRNGILSDNIVVFINHYHALFIIEPWCEPNN